MHSKIQEIASPLIASMGYIYWGLELILGGNRPTLRFYVESEGGINVDQCGEISREIGATLDVANVPEGEYTLEVSSPGLDRILFTLDQCRQYVGSIVSVTLTTSLEGRRRYKGSLGEVHSDAVTIGGDEGVLKVPFHKIKRIRIVPEF